jgi:hypothetical protein
MACRSDRCALRPDQSLERSLSSRRAASHIGWLTVVVAALSACAAHPAAAPRQMQTCVEGAAPAEVSAEAFAAGLREAQRYSDEKYGSDCFVCAEVFDRPEEYMLHITSPVDDMLINTSAAVTVRKSDGAITARGIWHSCHARIKKTSRLAPER